MKMEIRDYFENTDGRGILATADADGPVDLAVYSRPHFVDANTIALIMRDRLSHRNLQSNPHAAYMFIEKGPGHRGKRLHLKKIREENDPALIEEMRQSHGVRSGSSAEDSFLVYFTIERIRPLVGDGK